GDSSTLVQASVCPALTTAFSGPNRNSAIATVPGPEGFTAAPGAVPESRARDMTKSWFSCGLWQSKQALKLAFSFSLGFLSLVKAAYSHSPLRHSAGYAEPQPVRFSITPYPTTSPFTNRPSGPLNGTPFSSVLAACCTIVSTVPLGMGLPSRTALTASGVA